MCLKAEPVLGFFSKIKLLIIFYDSLWYIDTYIYIYTSYIHIYTSYIHIYILYTYIHLIYITYTYKIIPWKNVHIIKRLLLLPKVTVAFAGEVPAKISEFFPAKKNRLGVFRIPRSWIPNMWFLPHLFPPPRLVATYFRCIIWHAWNRCLLLLGLAF